jgi:hypothetical protein
MRVRIRVGLLTTVAPLWSRTLLSLCDISPDRGITRAQAEGVGAASRPFRSARADGFACGKE